MLSPEHKQRLLDAVRDMAIAELAEAGAFLVDRGAALRAAGFAAAGEKPAARFTVVRAGGNATVEADSLGTTPWGALALWKSAAPVALFAPGQWLYVERERDGEAKAPHPAHAHALADTDGCGGAER